MSFTQPERLARRYPQNYPTCAANSLRAQHFRASIAANPRIDEATLFVIDSQSVIIDLGRRSRLFTGPAREAVMLLEEIVEG